MNTSPSNTRVEERKGGDDLIEEKLRNGTFVAAYYSQREEELGASSAKHEVTGDVADNDIKQHADKETGSNDRADLLDKLRTPNVQQHAQTLDKEEKRRDADADHSRAGADELCGIGIVSASVPGAFEQVPTWRSQSSAESAVGDDHSLVFGVDTEFDSPPDRGLVQAEPVNEAIDMERALPVDASDPKQPQYKNWLILLGVVGLLVLVAVGLTVGLVVRSKYNSDMSSNQTQTINSTLAPTEWAWDLPFDIPDATLQVLLRDTEGVSPQMKAYQWMKQDPYYHTYSEERLLQRFAMVIFYYATHGEEWLHQGGGSATITIPAPSSGGLGHFGFFSPKPNQAQLGGNERLRRRQLKPQSEKRVVEVNITSGQWLSYKHSECEWFTTFPRLNFTASCDAEGWITYMDFDKNNLGGQLPEELGLLANLKSLAMNKNSIRGPIIPQIGALTNLVGLHMIVNEFTGLVPSELGLLRNLTSLGLLDNQLTGRLPPELWNMSNLKEVKIARNEFTGPLPSALGELVPNMEMFLVDRCQFSGTLPSSLGLWNQVFGLVITDNRFTGAIPTDLGQLPTLVRLFLNDNQLTGTVPTELGLLPQLRGLRLQGNVGIGGTLPSELQHLNSTLEELELQGTSITGIIPSGLCGLDKLVFDCSPSLCGCDCPCE